MRIRFLNHEMSSVHTAAFLMGAAGLLSRLFGMVRDRLLASHFGAGPELDIYYAAFQIPDFVSVIFLLGAGSAAILPVFQEYLARDRKKADPLRRSESEARQLISQLSTLFLLAALACGALVFILAPWLSHLAVPGFSDSDRALTVTLMRIMLCSPILLGLSSIFSAVIQSFERFVSYALAPVLYNLGIIAGIFFFVPRWGVAGLGLGVALGAFLHVAIQYISLSALDFSPRFTLAPIDAGMRKIISLSFPRVLSLAFTQLTVVMLTALASLLATGSISVFQFAQNLYFVPVGIFGVSYSVALFPRLNAAYLERNGDRFFREFFLGIRAILFWTIPSAVLFLVLRVEIVRVVLGGSAFSWENTQLTAACLGVLTVAMIAASLMSHLVKSFYALENTRMPLFMDMGGSAVSVALAFVFTKFISHSASFTRLLTLALGVPNIAHPEVLGISLGFSLGLAVNVILLYSVLVRFAGRVFGKQEHFPGRALLTMALASLGAGIAAYSTRMQFSQVLPRTATFPIFLHGFVAGIVGLLVYVGVLLLLKSEDMKTLYQSIYKRYRLFGLYK